MAKFESHDERIERIARLIDDVATASAQLVQCSQSVDGKRDGGSPAKWRKQLGVAGRKLMREFFGNDPAARAMIDRILT